MLAKHEGHRAFFCSGSPERREHLESLGIEPIDQKAFNRFTGKDDVKAFNKHVKGMTGGEGMQIVCDMLRGPVFAAGLAVLARMGVNVSRGLAARHRRATTTRRTSRCARSRSTTSTSRPSTAATRPPSSTAACSSPTVHREIYKFEDLPRAMAEMHENVQTGIPIVRVAEELPSRCAPRSLKRPCRIRCDDREAFPPRPHRGERRVALTPDAVKALVKDGIQVAVQAGAGAAAGFDDAALHRGRRARVAGAAEALAADLVLKVGAARPKPEIAALREGAAYIGFLRPLDAPAVARRLAQRRVTAFALELVPRITRAQSMDALSSQANLAGYRAVLLAALSLPRIFPMLVTAARHDPARARVRDRRGRGRAPGDRHRAPARRDRRGLRHARGGRRAGAEPRRALRRRSTSTPATRRTRAAMRRRRPRSSTSGSAPSWASASRRATS